MSAATKKGAGEMWSGVGGVGAVGGGGGGGGGDFGCQAVLHSYLIFAFLKIQDLILDVYP